MKFRLIIVALLLMVHGSQAQEPPARQRPGGFNFFSHDLTVITTTGGQVTSNPAGISVAADSTLNGVYNGGLYDLLATPLAGYVFTGWAGSCTGTGKCSINLGIDQFIVASFASLTPTVVPQTGLWWNPAEGGRGYTIEQNAASGNVFFAAYLYDANGQSIWYAAGPAQMSGTTFSAPLARYSGGQTLTGPYQQSAPGASPGNVSITFADAMDGILTWPGGTIPITRYAIIPGGVNATPTATQPQAGYWWNPAEGGRGYTIEVQNNIAYVAAFMYDANGNPVWYASGPAALTQGNTYQGSWVSYSGGQTLTGSYHAPNSQTANAGNLTMQFVSPTSGTLTLPDGRQIPIQRFGF
jgi:hypothetical protein